MSGNDDPWAFGTANQYPALKYGAQQTSWQWPVVTLSLSPTTIYEAVGGATTSTVTATSTTDWNHDLKVAVPQETTRYTVADITIPAGSTSATATLTAVNNYNCGSAACSTTNTAKVDYTKTMTLGTNPATIGTTTTTDTWVTKGATNPTLTITDDDELFQVTGVSASQDGGGIKVDWTKVANATGYKLCWKSGSQSYDSSRCATAGDVETHTIPESGTRFVAGTTYTLRVQSTKSGADDGLPSADVTVGFKGWIVVSETSVEVSEPSSGSTTGTYTVKLGSQPANNVTVTITRKAGSHASRPAFSPSSLTFSVHHLEHRPDRHHHRDAGPAQHHRRGRDPRPHRHQLRRSTTPASERPRWSQPRRTRTHRPPARTSRCRRRRDRESNSTSTTRTSPSTTPTATRTSPSSSSRSPPAAIFGCG